MMSSYQAKSEAQTPAWKKLGLKLKQSDASPSAKTTPAVGHRDGTKQSPMAKRKLGVQSTNDDSAGSNKRPRTAQSDSKSATPQLKKKKSVTFGETPSKNDGVPAKPIPPKKPKGPAKKKKQAEAPADINPALEYLRQWKTARDSWKFNKNHQSTLIKAVFDTGIPAADVDAFYEYIEPLKGFVRTRLRDDAMEIRVQDNKGVAAFPADTPDAETKQATYETIISNWLETLRVGQKRPYSEVEYTESTEDDAAVVQRVVKRMRAEMVLNTIADGYETEVSTTSVGSARATAAGAAAAKDATDTQVNGVPGKRRRKLRVNMDDSDSSSSESDSDSDSDSDGDSDTSSSGSSSSGSSSSESDSGDDEQEEEEDDESSSSSSSSSDDDSSDSDSDEEDTPAVAAKTS